MMKKLFPLLLILSVLGACVPSKKFQDIKSKKELCEEQRNALKEQNRILEEKFAETSDRLESMEKTNKSLKLDTTIYGKSLRLMTKNYDKLNETYELLLDKNSALLRGNQAETSTLFSNLQASQAELQKQSDALEKLRMDLGAKEKSLNKIQSELDERAGRVEELEAILARKDSAVNALKTKVQQALLGFENNGLTIEQRNGKVYVSLDESLLFKSGSYTVDSKGKEVIQKLSTVLEQNQDINVMVEGHTDNEPLNGSGTIKDNWDLSVLRATSVVKIMLENKALAQERLSASGRGEFSPIADNSTKAGRSKNRRTEVILTPKLDELLEILEAN